MRITTLVNNRCVESRELEYRDIIGNGCADLVDSLELGKDMLSAFKVGSKHMDIGLRLIRRKI